MKKAIVIIAAVAVVAVLLMAAFGVFATPASNQISGTMDVVIEEVDDNGNPTGEAMTASLSLSPLTPGEQMMLTFGQGVRATTMKPLAFSQSISGLSQNGHYKVWPRAAVKTTLGPDIASIKTSSIEFGGQPGHVGAPGLVDGDLTQYWLETSAGSGSAYKVIKVENFLVRNQTVQTNADNYASKFTHWAWIDSGVSANYIRGAEIDSMYLRCAVGITCLVKDGSSIGGGTLALLKLTVTSWTEAQIQVEIVGMSGGTQGLQISNALQAMIPCLGLVAIPAIGKEN